MAIHSSIPAWRIPWIEEPGGATVPGIPKNWTQQKWLSTYAHTAFSYFSVFFFFFFFCVILSLCYTDAWYPQTYMYIDLATVRENYMGTFYEWKMLPAVSMKMLWPSSHLLWEVKWVDLMTTLCLDNIFNKHKSIGWHWRKWERVAEKEKRIKNVGG